MFLRHTLPGLLWALLILVLCGIPGRDIPHVSFLEMLSFDKFVHASIFFVLVILLIHGFSKQTSFTLFRNNSRTAAFILCVVYGGALELMQEAVFEERSADIYDFIANSFGAAMGWLFYKQVHRYFLSHLNYFR